MVDQDPRAPPPKQEEGAAAHATYKGQVLALCMLQLQQCLKPSACTAAFLADAPDWEGRLRVYMRRPVEQAAHPNPNP